MLLHLRPVVLILIGQNKRQKYQLADIRTSLYVLISQSAVIAYLMSQTGQSECLILCILTLSRFKKANMATVVAMDPLSARTV